LHPQRYILSTISGDPRDAKSTKMLIAIIIELEKLQENRLKVQNNVGANQWCWRETMSLSQASIEYVNLPGIRLLPV
jgi:hypothetical protein